MKDKPYYDDTAGRIQLPAWTGEARMLPETEHAIDRVVTAAQGIMFHAKSLHNATMAHADRNTDPAGTRRRRIRGQLDRARAHLIDMAEELTAAAAADRAAQELRARERLAARNGAAPPSRPADPDEDDRRLHASRVAMQQDEYTRQAVADRAALDTRQQSARTAALDAYRAALAGQMQPGITNAWYAAYCAALPYVDTDGEAEDEANAAQDATPVPPAGQRANAHPGMLPTDQPGIPD